MDRLGMGVGVNVGVAVGVGVKVGVAVAVAVAVGVAVAVRVGVRVGSVVAVEGGETDVAEGRLVEVGATGETAVAEGWLVAVGTMGVLAGLGVAEGPTGVTVAGGVPGVGELGSVVGVNRGKVGRGSLGVGVERIIEVAVAPGIVVGVGPMGPGVEGKTVGLTAATTSSGWGNVSPQSIIRRGPSGLFKPPVFILPWLSASRL
jgi:hypothetical protein